MNELRIHQFLCRSDNYGVLIHLPDEGLTASIDAPDTSAVRAALKETGWRLSHIFTTHHHGDHTEGNAPLKRDTGCRIIGPRGEQDRVPGIDQAVGEGDRFQFGPLEVHVLETPGHTLGHISYWIPDASVAFVGDTLFALGCGRVFEGTPEMMWASLSKIAALPEETALYCGHEYTLANAHFAQTIEPGNSALQDRVREIERLRAEGKPTLPTTVGAELATNPFLRVASAEIRARLGMEGAPDAAVFAEVRRRKDAA